MYGQLTSVEIQIIALAIGFYSCPALNGRKYISHFPARLLHFCYIAHFVSPYDFISVHINFIYDNESNHTTFS